MPSLQPEPQALPKLSLHTLPRRASPLRLLA